MSSAERINGLQDETHVTERRRRIDAPQAQWDEKWRQWERAAWELRLLMLRTLAGTWPSHGWAMPADIAGMTPGGGKERRAIAGGFHVSTASRIGARIDPDARGSRAGPLLAAGIDRARRPP